MIPNLELKLKLFISLALLAAQCSLMAQPTDTHLEKTVIFKVKPEFRDLCSVSSIDYPSLNALIASLGTSKLSKKFPQIPPPRTKYNVEGIPLTDLSLIYELSYTGNVLLEKVIRFIHNSEITQYVQPHYLQQPHYIPNDDSASLSAQYHLNMIQAYAAWDLVKGDSTIVIGITDTGLDPAHIDLKNNLAYNYNDPIDGVDNDGDGWVDNYRGWDMGDNDNDPTSSGINFHHGNFVAGLAAASTDNGFLGAGVGFNCKFLPVKINRNSERFLSAAYEGVVYAAMHGCHIINCSWGGFSAGQFEQDIIDFATINKNALVIASAGNNGTEAIVYPASLNYVISAGGTDSQDVKFDVDSPGLSSSNFGRHLDVCAPGAFIWSTKFGSGFGPVNSGTSYSAPIIAGCAAIVKSKFPNYTPLQIGEQLKVTADNIDTVQGNAAFQEKLGSGRVNLFRAISDSSRPSIVMIKSFITDKNGGLLRIGDTVEIRGTFKNYLTATNGSITVEVTSPNPNITFPQGAVAALGPLNMLDTAGIYTTPLFFTISPSMGTDEIIELRFEYSDTSTIGFEYVTLTANPSLVDIEVNNIGTSMTSESLIGFLMPTAPDQYIGLGFQYKGESLIYEAGFMVGAKIVDTTYVSDNIRDKPYADADFEVVTVAKEVDSSFADIESHCLINDDGAGIDSMKISVDHTYYAWSGVPDNKYVMMTYRIINNGNNILTDLYAGILADWDIRNFTANKAARNSDLRMGYAYSIESGSPYAGIKLLSKNGFIHYAIDHIVGASGIDISDTLPFTTALKYIALSTNRAAAGVTGIGNDVLNVVSSGPFTLAPQDTVTVSFAMLAGDDLADLANSAFAAQAMYDSLFGEPEVNTAISKMPIAPHIELYPNPSGGELNLIYSGTKSESATFEIVDLTGRLVYAAFLDIGMVSSTHDVSNLKSGVYHYRIRSLHAERNGKLVIVQ